MRKDKSISLFGAVAICTGLVLSSGVFLTMGQGAALGGRWFCLSLLISALLYSLYMLSLSELNRMIPDVEGGLGQYALAAFGPAVSIVSISSVYLISTFILNISEMTLACKVIHELFLPQVPVALMAFVFYSLMTIINIFGVNVFAKVQNVCVTLLLISLLGLGFIGTFKLEPSNLGDIIVNVHPYTGFTGAVGLFGLAAYIYIGFEFLIPEAKYMKNSRKNLLMALFMGLVLLFVMYSLVTISLDNYIDAETLLSTELPNLLFGEAIFGHYGRLWMGVVTILAAISTLNTSMQGASRSYCGLANEGLYPKFFGKMNKYNSPYISVLIYGAVSTIMCLFFSDTDLVTLILTGTCFYLATYIIMHASVLKLRHKYPKLRKSNIAFGGIPQIIGIIGFIYMIINISSDPIERIHIVMSYLIITSLLIVYSILWTKMKLKKPLFRAVAIEELSEMKEKEYNETDDIEIQTLESNIDVI